MKVISLISDEELFYKVKNNDEKAFEQLFKKHYATLCRFAYGYLKNKDDSEEITQEVLVKIWNNRDKIEINSSVSAYFYRSVKNHALNFIKKNSRYSTASIDNIPEPIEGEASDENRFVELENKYKEALDSLPDKCREIFLLSRNHQLKYREIAEKLDLSVKTVEAQMSIALKRLKDSLSSFL